MKKGFIRFLNLVTVLALFTLCFTSFLACKQEKKGTQGLQYKYHDYYGGYYEVTGYTGTDEYVYIPSFYNDKPVMEIANDAFMANLVVTYVVFDQLSPITTIGYDTFSDCSQLQIVLLPPGLQSINSNAFNGCIELSLITLPPSLTYIGSYAFDGCISISEITIPSSVSYIGSYAFYGWQATQIINVQGYISVSEIDNNFWGWRSFCKATIVCIV